MANTRASKQGISFSEFVRRAVEKAVGARGSTDSEDDPFLSDKAVFRGKAPRDMAARHDDYLYGETDAQ